MSEIESLRQEVKELRTLLYGNANGEGGFTHKLLRLGDAVFGKGTGGLVEEVETLKRFRWVLLGAAIGTPGAIQVLFKVIG